jgi:hypothetical protein
MDESSVANSLHESIIRLDGRFKHHFFGLVSRDLNTLAMYIIKNKLATVESLFTNSYEKKVNEANSLFHTISHTPVQPVIIDTPEKEKKSEAMSPDDDEYDDYEEYFE